MDQKSNLPQVKKTLTTHPKMNIHFLDYSVSEFAELWKKETNHDKKEGFAVNRQNLTTAICDSPLFKDFFSSIFNREGNRFLPIPLETYPFFQNYIDVLRQDSQQKNTTEHGFSEQMLHAFFQNAYASIQASPEELSYYEKALCHTDAYCKFAASKVWEEELDYRIHLLKELLSKHSGQTQLEGVGNLLRTLDMYIAVYSKPPAKKEETSVVQCFQTILAALMQLRHDENVEKTATEFLLQQEQEFSGFDIKELEKDEDEDEKSEEDEGPLEIRPQDRPAFQKDKQKDNGIYYILLKSIYYMEKNKTYFKPHIRRKAKKRVRKIYLTSQASKVESTPFWEAYQDMKNYLDASDLISGDADLYQIIETYLSRYYQDIWFRGTLSYNSRNIDSTSTVSEVALDGLAKEAVEYFVGNNTKDISYFGEVKNRIITYSYQYSNILSDGYLLCIPQKAYKESLLSALDQLAGKMTEYIGEAFGRDFSQQCQALKLKPAQNIAYAWSSTLVKLFSKATEALAIPESKSITPNAVVPDLEYVIALIHSPDFVYPLRRASIGNPGLSHTPVLDYIAFILKMYYDFLDASKDVAEVFLLYWAYIKQYPNPKRSQPPKKKEAAEEEAEKS